MVASSVFGEWLTTLQGLGVFQYVLPFVLSFVIIYGILNKISLLGSEGNGDKLHTVVAAVISLFIIVYTPAGASLGTLFTNYFGALAVVLVGVFGALILLGLVFGDDWKKMFKKDGGDSVRPGVFILVGLIVLSIFFGWGGLSYLFPGLNLNTGIPQIGTANMIGILVVVGTILFLMWALDLRGGDSSGDPN